MNFVCNKASQKLHALASASVMSQFSDCLLKWMFLDRRMHIKQTNSATENSVSIQIMEYYMDLQFVEELCNKLKVLSWL